MASLWLSLGFHSWLSEASLLRKTLFFQSLDKRSLHGSDHQYGQLSYVATLGANIFDSSSSWRQPFKNSSSVRLPSLFSSILLKIFLALSSAVSVGFTAPAPSMS